MTEPTCPHCGDTMPNSRRVQCGKPGCRATWQRDRVRVYLAKRRAAGTHKRYTTWTCECVECGAEFTTTSRPKVKYCSTGKDSCEAKARSREYLARDDIGRVSEITAARERRATALLASVTEPPRNTAAYRRALKLDPCAYCGAQPSGGIDHITPAAHHEDRNDVENMAGCCKRCNAIKTDLPLLQALLWIPLSRAYHDQRRILWPKTVVPDLGETPKAA